MPRDLLMKKLGSNNREILESLEVGFLIGLLLFMILSFFIFYFAIPESIQLLSQTAVDASSGNPS